MEHTVSNSNSRGFQLSVSESDKLMFAERLAESRRKAFRNLVAGRIVAFAVAGLTWYAIVALFM